MNRNSLKPLQADFSASSAQATKSSDSGYIIKVGDTSIATVTVNDKSITVGETTLEGSGTVNVNGYALTLAAKDGALTSASAAELKSSTAITESQIYTVKLTENGEKSEDVTVTGTMPSVNTVTVDGKEVTLKIEDNTLKGTYDQTSESAPDNIIRSYTIKVGETTLATVTVDKDSKIKVNDTEYSGNFRINGYELTLAAKDGALSSASAAEIQSAAPTSGETVYSVKVDNTDNVESVKIADGKFVNKSTTYTTTVSGKTVTLTIDENGTLKGTYDEPVDAATAAFKKYVVKLGDTELATVTVDSENNIKVNGGDSTEVTVDGKTYKLTLEADENGALKTATAAEIKSINEVNEVAKYTVKVGNDEKTVTVDNGVIKDNEGNNITDNKITVGGEGGTTTVTLAYDEANKTLTGTYDAQPTSMTPTIHKSYYLTLPDESTATATVIGNSIKVGDKTPNEDGIINVGDYALTLAIDKDGKFTASVAKDGTPTTLNVPEPEISYQVTIDEQNVTFDGNETTKEINGKNYTLTLNGNNVDVTEQISETFTPSTVQTLTLTGNTDADTITLTLTTVGDNTTVTTDKDGLSASLDGEVVTIKEDDTDLLNVTLTKDESGSLTGATYSAFSVGVYNSITIGSPLTLPNAETIYQVKIGEETFTLDSTEITKDVTSKGKNNYTLTLEGDGDNKTVKVTEHVEATISQTSSTQTITLGTGDNATILNIILEGDTIKSDGATYRIGSGKEQTATVTGKTVKVGNIDVELAIEDGKVTKAEYPDCKVELAGLNLSTLGNGYEAQNGDTLTGTLSGGISIAAGATVTLNGVNLTGSITCNGDATIILSGKNTVTGTRNDYPGIYIPQDKTLTINGGGSLTAKGGWIGAGIGGGRNLNCGNIVIEGGTINATGDQWAAGIGGSNNASCGDIEIKGGNVTATGGTDAAGIGSGFNSSASCGNITISGGTIEATGGGSGAGIGSGFNASCGNITITDGVESVTAKKGDATNSIGTSGVYYGSCGTVTIKGVEGAITDNTTIEGNGSASITDDTESLTLYPNGQDVKPAAYTDIYRVTIGDTTVSVTFDDEGNLATAVDSTGTNLISNDKVTIGIGDSAKNYTLTLADNEGTKTVNVTEHIPAAITQSATEQVITLGTGNDAITLTVTLTNDGAISSAKCKLGSGSEAAIAESDITGSTVKVGGINVDLTIEGGKVTNATYLDYTTESKTETAELTPNVDLSTLTEDYTAQDGDILGGTLGANVKISIADGATVTLSGATINGTNSDSCNWAGINCLGDATIILEGTNNVKGFYENYPGIYVPQNKTLTIKGTGSLDASSNGFSGAGIGGGYQISCGNITIEDGTITATGGYGAAGIGSGHSGTCGNITIKGVGAIRVPHEDHPPRDDGAAGIGSGGWSSSCGNIVITGVGVIRVPNEEANPRRRGYPRSTRGSGNSVSDNIAGGNIVITGVGAIRVPHEEATTSLKVKNNIIGAGDGSIEGTVTIGGFVGVINLYTYTYTGSGISAIIAIFIIDNNSRKI